MVSGVYNTSRLIGGTIGLAIMGSMLATLERSKLHSEEASGNLSAVEETHVHNLLAGGKTGEEALKGLSGPRGAQLEEDAREVFDAAFASTLKLSALIALAGAAVACSIIPKLRAPGSRRDPGREPDPAGGVDGGCKLNRGARWRRANPPGRIPMFGTRARFMLREMSASTRLLGPGPVRAGSPRRSGRLGGPRRRVTAIVRRWLGGRQWHEVRRARQVWQDTMHEKFVAMIENTAESALHSAILITDHRRAVRLAGGQSGSHSDASRAFFGSPEPCSRRAPAVAPLVCHYRPRSAASHVTGLSVPVAFTY